MTVHRLDYFIGERPNTSQRKKRSRKRRKPIPMWKQVKGEFKPYRCSGSSIFGLGGRAISNYG